MQKSIAITKYIRVQPRKARLAADLIRGLPIEEAEMQLNYCHLKASPYLKKTLKSAVANAEMGWDARREKLRVLEVRVDDGPRFKRAKPKCRGGRTPILKKMSHLTVIVGEGEVK